MAPFEAEEWRVHLGAHKTATTHLQATLWSLRFDLPALGAAYVPCGDARPLLRRPGTLL